MIAKGRYSSQSRNVESKLQQRESTNSLIENRDSSRLTNTSQLKHREDVADFSPSKFNRMIPFVQIQPLGTQSSY